MLTIPQYIIQIFANPQLNLIATFYPIMQFPNSFQFRIDQWVSFLALNRSDKSVSHILELVHHQVDQLVYHPRSFLKSRP